ncbi:MAG TPA: hypothetical protein VH349_06660 [Ktedonobacterales bacterium]|jgi:hypothetical protein
MTITVEDYFQCYSAPYELQDTGVGTWYSEYSGIFPTRQFALASVGAVAVAPFDLPFGFDKDSRALAPGLPLSVKDRLPPMAGVKPISFADFERLWESHAQPRIHEVAQHARQVSVISPDGDATMYVASPFPASFKGSDDTEGDSTLYFEYAAGIGRRFFELWASGEVWVSGPGEVGGAETLVAARDGLDRSGEEIEPGLRPLLITHAEFEAVWERYAIPYLHRAARLG